MSEKVSFIVNFHIDSVNFRNFISGKHICSNTIMINVVQMKEFPDMSLSGSAALLSRWIRLANSARIKNISTLIHKKR